VYIVDPKPNGYLQKTQLLAVRMYVEGNSYGAIARILKVNPQSVANWVRQNTANLPPTLLPEKMSD
jgi:transposase-like protein